LRIVILRSSLSARQTTSRGNMMSRRRFFSPFDELFQLENEVSDIFRTYHSQFNNGANRLPVNVWEDENAYRIMAEMPGFDIEDINIEATSQYVDISANRDNLDDGDEQKLLIQEIPAGVYQRRINFDKPVDTSSARTLLRKGVLNIILPKTAKSRTVKLTPEVIEN